MRSRRSRTSEKIKRAIREQYPDDYEALIAKAPRKSLRAKIVFDEIRKSYGGRLPVGREPLRIWLPKHRLPSLNTVLGSGSKHAQTAERSRALAAFHGIDCPLWRFETRVDIHVIMAVASFSKVPDSPNLYDKHSIDALTEGRGIGVIPDDSPKWLRYTSRAVELCPDVKAPEPGVIIIVTPVA